MRNLNEEVNIIAIYLADKAQAAMGSDEFFLFFGFYAGTLDVNDKKERNKFIRDVAEILPPSAFQDAKEFAAKMMAFDEVKDEEPVQGELPLDEVECTPDNIWYRSQVNSPTTRSPFFTVKINVWSSSSKR